MAIEGYVREPHPGEEWRESPTPAGFRLVIVDELQRAGSGWQAWAVPANAPRCRRPMCGRQSVVGLMRGTKQRSKWGYCDFHLYGRRWENGQLLYAILVPEDEQP